MIKILIYIIFLSFNLHAIGFDALNIPSDSMDMSLSGSGIASQYFETTNPSSNIEESSKIGFSANKWIVDIKGNSFYYINNGYKLTYSNFKIDGIELRNNSPSDSPLDFIESNLLSIGLSKGYSFSKKIKFGVGIKYHYNQLFIDKSSALTFDLGMQNQLMNNFQIGILIKNLGLNNIDIPTTYGVGSSYYLKNTKTEFLADYIYSTHYSSGVNLGLIQSIKIVTLNIGYSKFSNLRTTLSSGFKINLNKKYNLLYSLLSIQNSNFGLAHYFGFEISL